MKFISIPLAIPAWSCAFSESARNVVFVGKANGEVSSFDLRNSKRPIADYCLIKDNKKLPVHSIFCFESEVFAASLSGLFCITPDKGGIVTEISTPIDSSGARNIIFKILVILLFDFQLFVLVFI